MDNPFLRPTPDFKPPSTQGYDYARDYSYTPSTSPISYSRAVPQIKANAYNAPDAYNAYSNLNKSAYDKNILDRSQLDRSQLDKSRYDVNNKNAYGSNPFTRPTLDIYANKTRLASDYQPSLRRNPLQISAVKSVSRYEYHSPKPQRNNVLDESNETYINKIIHYPSHTNFTRDLKENNYLQDKYEQYRYKPKTTLDFTANANEYASKPKISYDYEAQQSYKTSKRRDNFQNTNNNFEEELGKHIRQEIIPSSHTNEVRQNPFIGKTSSRMDAFDISPNILKSSHIPIVSNINAKQSKVMSKNQFKDLVDDGAVYGSDDSFDKPFQFGEEDFPSYKESIFGLSSKNIQIQKEIKYRKVLEENNNGSNVNTSQNIHPEIINIRGIPFYKALVK